MMNTCEGCEEKTAWLRSAKEHAERQKQKIKRLNNYIGELQLEIKRLEKRLETR